jgi:tetratricopeptide (TPR) repeat protein
LLVGWLWYLGMMVPVIGLLQIGIGNGADRFTYLPQIGLAIALAWTLADACRAPQSRWGGAAAATCGLVILIISTWRQTCYWDKSETLLTHAVACTSQNALAHCNLGLALWERGKIDEGMAHFQKALEIKPDYPQVHFNLGTALASRGQMDEAIQHYETALRLKPDYVAAHVNLGITLATCGRTDEAIAHLRRAIEIDPSIAEAHNNLGSVLASRGAIDDATVEFQKAVEIKPEYADAHRHLGIALAARGRVDEAIEHYRKALTLAKRQNNAALANELTARLRSDEAGDSRPAP